MSGTQKIAAAIIFTIFVAAVGVAGYQASTSESGSNSNSGAQGGDQTSGQFADFLGSANKGATSDQQNKSEVTVKIDDFIFDPTILTISTGTKVTWTNEGKVQHNVVSHSSSPEKGLESELLSNGKSYSYTFDKPGTYYYFCEPHPTSMRGVVIVK